MSAADLPFGTIIADGPRVLVKLGSGWHEAMPHRDRPQSDDEVDWCLENGYTVVRHGLG